MKRLMALIFVLSMILGLIGCMGSETNISDEECQPLEYEIIEQGDVSQKIKEKMFDKRENPYFFTYSDGKEMFIAIGYGARPTGGYSIKILSVDQCGEKIIVKTELIEPAKEDVVTTTISYPSIILKIADMECEVEVHAK